MVNVHLQNNECVKEFKEKYSCFTNTSSRTTSKCSFVFVWGSVYVNHSHTLCPYVTCDSLLIEGTAAASGRAIFAESLCELLVQPVSHAAWDPLPGQDENDYHCVLTAVTSTLPHETQQLLFLTSSTYDLQNLTHVHTVYEGTDILQALHRLLVISYGSLTHLAIGQPCELRPSLPVNTTTSTRTALPFSPYLWWKQCSELCVSSTITQGFNAKDPQIWRSFCNRPPLIKYKLHFVW